MKVPTPIASLLQRFGVMKKRPMPLTREDAFKAYPVRNPQLKWRINPKECVEVIVPRRKDWFGRTVGFLFFVPENRPVTLDEVGTRVWHLCDGENTVSEIIEALCKEYKLGRREVEASLTEYLRTLGQRGMVGFLVPKELIDEEDASELVGLEDVGTSREDLDAAKERARDSEDAEAAEAAEAAGETGEEDAADQPEIEADEEREDDPSASSEDEAEPVR